MNLLNLTIFIIFTEIVGLFGGFISTPGINDWYGGLNKAPFNPPGWVFGPVWIVLYFIMGVSAYLIWEKSKKSERKFLISLYFIQLLFNFIWSYLFFGLHQPLLAFFDIIVLLLLLIFITIKYFKVSKYAGYIMGVYVAWVTFASVLNLWVVLYN